MTDSGTITPLALVAQFYRRIGRQIRRQPTADLPAVEVHQLIALLDEEVGELRKGLVDSDLAKIAERLGDVVYAAYGAALQYGIDLDVVIRAIHEANMTKADSAGVSPGEKATRGRYYVPSALDVPPALEDALDRMHLEFGP